MNALSENIAFLGIGFAELLVIAVLFGIPITIVGLVLFFTRKKGQKPPPLPKTEA